MCSSVHSVNLLLEEVNKSKFTHFTTLPNLPTFIPAKVSSIRINTLPCRNNNILPEYLKHLSEKWNKFRRFDGIIFNDVITFENLVPYY